MFGLSFREKTIKLIQNSCVNNIKVYRDALEPAFGWMLSVVDEEGNLSEEDEAKWEHLLQSADIDYRNAVSDSVLAFFKNGNSNIHARVELAMKSPSIVGIDDYDISKGLGAGVLYAITYTSLTNKQSKSSDMVNLNHFQYDLIQQVVKELTSKASEQLNTPIEHNKTTPSSPNNSSLAESYTLAASSLIDSVAAIFRQADESNEWENIDDFIFFQKSASWFATLIVCNFKLSGQGYSQDEINDISSEVLFSAFQALKLTNSDGLIQSYHKFVEYFESVSQEEGPNGWSYYQVLAYLMYKWCMSPLVVNHIISEQEEASIGAGICLSLTQALEEIFI